MQTLERPPAEAGDPSPLVDAALAPTVRAGRRSLLLLVALAVPATVGLVAWLRQLDSGLAVTGLNNQVFWGVYEVDLVTFIGLSYGGALVSAILRLTNAHWRGPISRIAEGSALVTLCVGALFPIVHVGHPERLWEFATRPNPHSPVVWDLVAILTYLMATLVLFGLPLIPDLSEAAEHPDLGRRRRRLYRFIGAGWRGTDAQHRLLDRMLLAVSIGIVPLAVMVHTALSYAFALTSRPGWHTAIFGPYFVVAAVYSGVAVVILATVAYRRAYHLEAWIPAEAIRYLSYLLLALAVTYGYFLFTDVTTEGYVGEQPAESVLSSLLLKRYAPLFWTFVVAGLVLPVLLTVVWRSTASIAAAAALVVGSLWIKRFLMFVPPLTRSLVGTTQGSYSPTWVEWAITAGAAAAIPLLLIVLFRFVPVLSIDEMQSTPGPTTAVKEGRR